MIPLTDAGGNVYLAPGTNFAGGTTSQGIPTPPTAAQIASAAWNSLLTPGTAWNANTFGSLLRTYTATPSDYQQRGVAVTLPTTAPTGYGGSGSGPTAQQIATQVLNTVITPGG